MQAAQQKIFSVRRFLNVKSWHVATAAVWLGAAISAWYWVKAGTVPDAGPALQILAMPTHHLSDANRVASVAKVLGAASLASPQTVITPADRFTLSGIIADSRGGGVALISVDGKTAQPFRVGSELAAGYAVVAVAADRVMLSEQVGLPAQAVLVLPLWQPARTADGRQVDARASAQNGVQVAAADRSAYASYADTGRLVNDAAQPVSNKAAQVLVVTARADARRQPQSMLRRSDQRSE